MPILSDKLQKNLFFIMASIGALWSTITVVLKAGEMKGTLDAVVADHSKRIQQREDHDTKTDAALQSLLLSTEYMKAQNEALDSKLHGVSSLVGRYENEILRAVDGDKPKRRKTDSPPLKPE